MEVLLSISKTNFLIIFLNNFSFTVMRRKAAVARVIPSQVLFNVSVLLKSIANYLPMKTQRTFPCTFESTLLFCGGSSRWEGGR